MTRKFEWNDIDHDVRLREAVEQIRRDRGRILDTWDTVRRVAHRLDCMNEPWGHFNQSEAEHREYMVHGQPASVEGYAYFVDSFVQDADESGNRVRYYRVCCVDTAGDVQVHPLVEEGVTQLFADPNQAFSLMYAIASEHAQMDVRPGSPEPVVVDDEGYRASLDDLIEQHGVNSYSRWVAAQGASSLWKVTLDRRGVQAMEIDNFLMPSTHPGGPSAREVLTVLLRDKYTMDQADGFEAWALELGADEEDTEQARLDYARVAEQCAQLEEFLGDHLEVFEEAAGQAQESGRA